MDIDAKREMRPNTFGMVFPFLYFFGLFFLALILKCRGSHILGSGGRTLKAGCDLLHLVCISMYLY